jgi:hypothetical protein
MRTAPDFEHAESASGYSDNMSSMSEIPNPGMGLHSFIFQLNVSAFHGRRVR